MTGERVTPHHPEDRGSRTEPVPIIILNWNGWKDTFHCLQSIADTGEHHEVWLIDNNSRDDRSAEAKAIYPNMRLFPFPDNYGWAKAHNLALKIAADEGREFAYLLNNDCAVHPGFLHLAVVAAQTDRRIAAVGSRICYSQPSGFVMFDGNYFEPGERPASPDDGVRLASELFGSGMLVKITAMRQVGYFDERYFCYGEETEWCARASAGGWLLAVAAASVVEHVGKKSDTNANALYYEVRNAFLLRRVPGLRNRAPGVFRYVYTNLRAASNAQRTGRPLEARAIAEALWDGLAGNFGKRSTSAPLVVIAIATRAWPFPSGFFRRLVSAVPTPSCRAARFRGPGSP